MGLTVQYNYHTKGKISDKAVFTLMGDLLAYATQLESEGVFSYVSELRYFDASTIEAIDNEFELRRKSGNFEEFVLNPDIVDPAWEWPLVGLLTSNKTVKKTYKLYKRAYRKPEWKTDIVHHSVKPDACWMFSFVPGNGSESATIALVHYPKTIFVKNPAWMWNQDTQTEFVEVKTGFTGWSWSSFCKTQYANRYGIANFLRTHVGLIAFLDYMKRFTPLEVEISDEGEFYSKRNIQELAIEIQKWDDRLKGLLDTFSDFPGQIVAPITEWNPYEGELPDGIDELFKQENLVLALRYLVELSKDEETRLLVRPIKTVDDSLLWWRIMASRLPELEKQETPLGQAAKDINMVFMRDFEGNYPSKINPLAFADAVRVFMTLYK